MTPSSWISLLCCALLIDAGERCHGLCLARKLTRGLLAYIPHSFDYPLHTESESFEQIRTISDQPPFAIEDVGHPRPDGCGYGYGSLGQVMMLQPLSLPSTSASRYTTLQPGAQDMP